MFSKQRVVAGRKEIKEAMNQMDVLKSRNGAIPRLKEEWKAARYYNSLLSSHQ